MGLCIGAAASTAMQPCLRLSAFPTRRSFQSPRRTQIAPLAVSVRQGGSHSTQQSASAGTPVATLQRAAGLALPAAATQLLAAAQASAMGGMAPAGGAAPGAGDAATGLMTAGAQSFAIGQIAANLISCAQEPMITGMFGAAVLALVVVTGGAAYLAITGILDERTEKKDRDSFSSQSAKKLVQRDRSKAQTKGKVKPSKGGGKGFS